MTSPIEVLLISGSIRQPSYTRALTKSVERVLVEHGAATTLWDLAEAPLPIADPSFHIDPSQHINERVRDFIRIADQCNAFVLSSPIYHNSYSGVIKNALDHLVIPHFRYKPVGLIGHGANRSTQAVDHLRIVVRGLSGIAIPTQVCTCAQDYHEVGAETYQLNSENILVRIEQFVSELLVLARQVSPIRQLISKDN